MILLTGATGFLGHNLVPYLLEAGYQVRALVRPTSQVTFLQEAGVELAYVDDIADATAVIEAAKGCRQIIHVAGRFRFWGDADEFIKTNVHGTRAVLEAALANDVERMIHISTIVVVGKTPVSGVIDENVPCYPLDPYQQSKLEGERLAISYFEEKGVPTIVLRPGAFYGPWGRYAFNRLFFEEPLNGWRIKVNHGRHINFPVFIYDVVQGLCGHWKKGGLVKFTTSAVNHWSIMF